MSVFGLNQCTTDEAKLRSAGEREATLPTFPTASHETRQIRVHQTRRTRQTRPLTGRDRAPRPGDDLLLAGVEFRVSGYFSDDGEYSLRAPDASGGYGGAVYYRTDVWVRENAVYVQRADGGPITTRSSPAYAAPTFPSLPSLPSLSATLDLWRALLMERGHAAESDFFALLAERDDAAGSGTPTGTPTGIRQAHRDNTRRLVKAGALVLSAASTDIRRYQLAAEPKEGDTPCASCVSIR